MVGIMQRHILITLQQLNNFFRAMLQRKKGMSP